MPNSDTQPTSELPKKAFVRVSPTQVELYRACPRKWYTSYVLGLKPPPTDAMALGSQVHSHLEAWLRDGLHPVRDADYTTLPRQIAAHGIDQGLLPEPGSVVVEGAVDIQGAPLPMLGIIDVVDRCDPETGIAIHDHKTSSGKGWMKTPEELAVNVQMCSYAHHALQRFAPDAQTIRLRHIYYGTPGKRGAKRRWSDQRQVVVTRQEVAVVWAGICTTIEEMIVTARLEEAAVPQHIQSCSAFGGCPFADRCWADEAQPLSPLSPVRNTSTMPKPNPLQALLGVQADGSPLPPPPNGSSAPPTPVAALPQATPLDINPPEGVLPEEVAIEAQGMVLDAPQPPQAPKRRRRRSEDEIDVDQAYAADHGVSEKTATKRRLARGVEEEAASPAPSPPPAAVAPPPPAVDHGLQGVSMSKMPEPAAAAPLKYLFVGCVPLKGGLSFVEFTEWVGPFQAEVARSHGVPHIAAMDFGKGYGFVAARVAKEPWPDEVSAVVFDPMCPYAKGSLDIMMAKADVVIRKL